MNRYRRAGARPSQASGSPVLGLSDAEAVRCEQRLRRAVRARGKAVTSRRSMKGHGWRRPRENHTSARISEVRS
jgi:hypothetical protein